MSDEEQPSGVLLTSVGSRVDLVDAFRSAVGRPGRVVVSDRDAAVTAMAFADAAFVSPPFASEDYLGWITELCRDLRIGLVVPLHEQDGERLTVIAEHLRQRSTWVVSADAAAYRLVADKLALPRLASAWGLRAPPTTTPDDREGLLSFGDVPLMVKPRYGRGSRGLRRYPNPDGVLGDGPSLRQEPMIVQPVLQGTEYGLDVVNDLKGEYRTSFQRRKLAMAAGETAAAETCWDPELGHIARAIGAAIRHRGCLDVDLIHHRGAWFVLDLNLRFGGGYPFSHAAGADLPAALVAWSRGREAPLGWDQPRIGVRGLRTSHVRTVVSDRPDHREDEDAPGLPPR